MSETTEPADGSGTSPDSTEPAFLRRVPRIGIWAWSFVGLVIALIIIAFALSAVSEIALPMTFAAVLAIVFKPLVGTLERHKVKASLAAGVIVLGLLALMAGVGIATVRGVTEQADEIGTSVDKAISKAGDESDALGISEQALKDARKAIEDAEPEITTGVLSGLVSGIGALVAIAGGVILGALIMYYLLKDGSKLRQAVVKQADPALRDDVDDFIGDSIRTLRDYGQGRSIMSAIVAVVIGVAALLMGLPLVFTIIVVNFIGGYIPYIGAFLGGGLAVIIALGDGGLPEAILMLVIVLAANLVLENFVEPKVMGRTLDIHPLVVLIVTALGGLLGGIVGLILAVPAWVIASNAISRALPRSLPAGGRTRATHNATHARLTTLTTRGTSMMGTRKRRTATGVLVATTLVIAWTVPAQAASSTSAKQWANGVCSAVQSFATSVDTTISGLKGSDSLESASQSAKDGLQSAVTDLGTSLRDLGKPTSSDGKQAQAAVNDLSDQLSKDVAAIQDSLTPPPSTRGEIASTFADIGSQIQKAVSQTKSTAETLKGLKPNGALQKAFQSAPACTALKQSSSSS